MVPSRAPHDLLDDAARRAKRYLDALPERPLRPSASAVARLRELDKLPDAPVDPREVLARLDEIGSPATLATAGPRFHGFVIGGSLPVAVAAHWLATAWDQNAHSWTSSPTSAALEETALRWLVDLFGLPEGTGGGFVTGGTMANFTALAAARHHVLARAGWDVERDGLFGAPPLRVVVSEESHPTVHKALGLLGLGRERVERAPVDAQGRVRADALPPLDERTIVAIQAGNVNTGAFDPIEEVAERAERAGAWLHVDGAFGLWAAAAPSLRGHVRGLARADSWSVDAHKWLNVPYDCGVALVRHPEALRKAMAVSAAYLPSGERREPSEYVPELSRRARGTDVWAALAHLGRSGVAEMVERNARQARRYAEGLRAAGHDVLNDVVLNQVLVSFGAPERTRAVVAALQEEGEVWVGPTVWQGRTAMRISVSSWATTDADVERALAAMLRAAEAAR